MTATEQPFRLFTTAWIGVFALILVSLWPSADLVVVRWSSAIALALSAVTLWRTGDARAVMAPALALAFFFVVLLVILPGVIPVSWPRVEDFNGRALRSEGRLATRMLAAFSGLLLAHALAMGRMVVRRPWVPEMRQVPWTALIVVTMTAILAASIYGYGYRSAHDPLTPQLGRTLATNIYEAIPPILSLIVASLITMAATRARALLPALVAGCALVGSIAATLTIKLPMLVLSAAAVAMLRRAPPSRRKSVIGLSIPLALVVVLGLTVVFMVRMQPHRLANPLAEIESVLSSALQIKFGQRFVATYMCFSRVLEQHASEAKTETSPFYFTAGLVPRVLWTDKPALSHGDDYSERYCDTPLNPENPGSMSVTLMGEPMIEAGWVGMAAAACALFLYLTAFSRLCVSLKGPGLAWMAAMAPWLWDVDQSFAMYLAGSLKAALIMAPLVLAWWKWNERA